MGDVQPRVVAPVRLAAVAVALAVLASCQSSGPSSRALVRTAIGAASPAQRAQAARSLADRLDPAAVGTLAGRAQVDPRGAEALAVVRDRLIALYRDKAAKDRVRRTKVVRTLARVDDEPAAAAVAQALADDPDARVRRAALTSLAGMQRGRSGAVGVLVERRNRLRSDDPRSPDLEQALAGIGGPAVPALIDLMFSEGWAAAVVARIGPPAVEPVTRLVTERRPNADLTATKVLRVIERQHPGSTTSAWPVVVSALVARLEPGRTTQALAEAGPFAVQPLVDLARQSQAGKDRPEQDRIATAAFALTEVVKRDRAAAAPLEEALARGDTAMVVDLHRFYVNLGKPGSEDALIAALGTLSAQDPRSSTMVVAFLDSGNPKLVQAARDWAAKGNLTLTGSPKVPGAWASAGVYPR
jgi:hypothetical protein